jgi:uncharacterized protein
MKVVFDTNVYISAFVFKGVPFEAYELCIQQHEVYISAFIQTEVLEKFSTKFKLPEPALNLYKEILASLIIETPTNPLPIICRDPDDNHILQLAEFVKAHYLITGDKDLLILEQFGPTKIITPAQFMQAIS